MKARVAAAFLAVGLLTLFGVSATPARAATGRTFYLSPNGNDQADGQSRATAWKSLSRASQQRFRPGDKLLLQGGAEFPGQLLLLPADAGTAQAPVTISSYGTGRPRIRANGLEAIKVYDAGGIEIRGVDVVGDQSTYNDWDGILFYADAKVPGRLAHITVDDVDVSGFKRGITLASEAAGHGFQDVVISNSSLHGNRDEGLLSYGPNFDADTPSYAHTNVRVLNVTAHDNAGNPQNTTSHSGSGIILGSVQNGVIQASSAYDNGAACASTGEGPVGIWTYDSTGITIQRNVAYANKSGTTADGGGFDLDQNVSDSVLQYNLSYGNAGPGLLVYTAQSNAAQSANTVRFNVSVGDAQGNGSYGGLTIAGRIAGASISNNTIVTRPSGGHRPPAVKLGMTGLSDDFSGLSLRNNILYSQGAGPAVSSASAFGTDKLRLQANSYYRTGGGSPIEWGAHQYGLNGWRKATGQEKAANGKGLGIDADPKLQDASATPAVTDPNQVTAVTQFALAGGSPAGGRGLSLGATDAGTVDFFGATLGGSRPVSIGAAQPAEAGASSPYTAEETSPGGSRGTLWIVALVLLVLVGGGALTVFGRQLRRNRRPLPPPPAHREPSETIIVPSARADDYYRR